MKTNHASLNEEILSESNDILPMEKNEEEMKQILIQEKKFSVDFFFDTVWKARCMVLLCAILYGTNYTIVKIVGETIPSVEVGGALRFGISALVTLPWLLRRTNDVNNPEWIDSVTIEDGLDDCAKKKMIAPDTLGCLLGGFEIGVINTIGYFGQARGLETIPASVSAFCSSLIVVTIPLLNKLTGKKIALREVVGAFIAITGVTLLEGGLKETAKGGDSLLTGILYSLMQPLFFGIAFRRIEHYSKMYPTGGLRLTAAQMMTIAVLFTMGSFGLGTAQGKMSQLQTWLTNPVILGSLFWTGAVTTALTICIETLAMRTISSSEVTMIFSTVPVWASIFSFILLGESMDIQSLIGATFVLGGCIYSLDALQFIINKGGERKNN